MTLCVVLRLPERFVLVSSFCPMKYSLMNSGSIAYAPIWWILSRVW